LNPRPLGYESNPIVARPFCSITYGDDVLWFFLLFGRFCGRSVVENRPSVGGSCIRINEGCGSGRDFGCCARTCPCEHIPACLMRSNRIPRLNQLRAMPRFRRRSRETSVQQARSAGGDCLRAPQSDSWSATLRSRRETAAGFRCDGEHFFELDQNRCFTIVTCVDDIVKSGLGVSAEPRHSASTGNRNPIF